MFYFKPKKHGSESDAPKKPEPPEGKGLFGDLINVYNSRSGTQFVLTQDLITDDLLEKLQEREKILANRRKRKTLRNGNSGHSPGSTLS